MVPRKPRSIRTAWPVWVMTHGVVRITVELQRGHLRSQERVIDHSPAMSGGGPAIAGVPGGVGGGGSWALAPRASISAPSAVATMKTAKIALQARLAVLRRFTSRFLSSVPPPLAHFASIVLLSQKDRSGPLEPALIGRSPPIGRTPARSPCQAHRVAYHLRHVAGHSDDRDPEYRLQPLCCAERLPEVS